MQGKEKHAVFAFIGGLAFLMCISILWTVPLTKGELVLHSALATFNLFTTHMNLRLFKNGVQTE